MDLLFLAYLNHVVVVMLQKWDLIGLTQNYLKLLLAYLRESENGLLIHCISGWDRTPLFVSLLRLSLWADGAIHKSLNAEQVSHKHTFYIKISQANCRPYRDKLVFRLFNLGLYRFCT